MNRLTAISIATILLVMMAAPAIQAKTVRAPVPVYASCPTSNGTPSHLLVFFYLSNPTGLSAFLSTAYYSPTNPDYHKFMTSGQFDALYAAPSSVVLKVNSILSHNGLVPVVTGPMLIEASGTDLQVQTALVQLSRTTSIQSSLIGAECMPETLGVQPSQTSQIPYYTPDLASAPYVGPAASVTTPATNECNYNAEDSIGQIWYPCGLQTIYDENPLFGQGSSGSGQTIALVDAFGDPAPTPSTYTNLACSDLAAFDTTFALPSASCNIIYPTGVPAVTAANYGAGQGWATETGIDTQYSHVMAPQAHILEVTSSTDFDDLYGSIEYVVNNQLANMISLSWGSWEDLFYYPPSTAALMLGYDEIFQQAAAQGISVFASSGDYGAYDPTFLYPDIAASSPATDPWVTAVGGTTLFGTFTATTVQRTETAWSLGLDSWNPYIATGGGYSMFFPETQGQSMIHITAQLPSIYLPKLGITFYPQGQRGVPDVSADADPASGVLVMQDGSFSPYVWGGTSLAAPLTAGMTATIASSHPYFTIGDLAPSMYVMYKAGLPPVYVHGTSFGLSGLSTGLSGVMFLTSSGENGPFHVTPGIWNPVTGLGQLNVYGTSQLITIAD